MKTFSVNCSSAPPLSLPLSLSSKSITLLATISFYSRPHCVLLPLNRTDATEFKNRFVYAACCHLGQAVTTFVSDLWVGSSNPVCGTFMCHLIAYTKFGPIYPSSTYAEKRAQLRSFHFFSPVNPTANAFL